MMWLLLGCLVSIAAFGESGVPPRQIARDVQEKEIASAEIKCLAGTEWGSNCLRCRCSESGAAVCSKIENCDIPSVSEKSDLPTGKECASGSFWSSQCNDCACSPKGYAFCTEKLCSERLSEPSLRCAPDSKWRDKCNVCWCDNGRAVCTKLDCEQNTRKDNDNQSETKTSTSNVTILSRKARSSLQGPPKACQPGQEFRMDCNQCLCDNNGQDFSCTRIDCTALNNNNNGGPRAKREATAQSDTQCVPGTISKLDCNVCQCTQKGQQVCTNKECEIKENQENSDINESDPGFRCTPGEQFRRGCNDCTCSADGKSVFCTLRLCDKDIPIGI